MTDEQNEKEPLEENFFEQMENAQSNVALKRLQRSRTDFVIAGVCSGIAEYFGVEVANIRLIAILSLLLGGWSVVAYLLTAALLPTERIAKELSTEEKFNQRKENFRTVLSGILILIGFHFALVQIGFSSGNSIFILPNGFVFPLLSVAVGVYLLVFKHEVGVLAEEQHTPFKRTRDNRLVLGVCGGIGKYLNVDETTVRMIFLFATLLTLGLFAVGYVAIGSFTDLEEENKIEPQ